MRARARIGAVEIDQTASCRYWGVVVFAASASSWLLLISAVKAIAALL